jgi:hypothetical protein
VLFVAVEALTKLTMWFLGLMAVLIALLISVLFIGLATRSKPNETHEDS